MREECALQRYLTDHPEIKQVRLVWVWPFRAVVEDGVDYGDNVLLAEGTYIDEEYTFVGGREDCIEYLDHYDVWDFIEDEDIPPLVRDGRLSRLTEGYEDDLHGYTNRIPEPVYAMTSDVVPYPSYPSDMYESNFYRLCEKLGANL